jgi:hypothetical protein
LDLVLLSIIPYVPRKGALTSYGISGMSWVSIRWWQMVDVPELPGIQAIEIEWSWRWTSVTRRIGFDPSEVDEKIVLEFLRKVAPEKERRE